MFSKWLDDFSGGSIHHQSPAPHAPQLQPSTAIATISSIGGGGSGRRDRSSSARPSPLPLTTFSSLFPCRSYPLPVVSSVLLPLSATDGRTDCDSTASHDDDGVTLIIVSSRVSESLQFCIFLDTNFHLLFFHQTGRPTKKKVQETEE